LELQWQDEVFRVAWAVMLGTIIGLEREYTQKSAGLRTHILVCLGATVFTIISVSDLTQGMLLHNIPSGADVRINMDPGRIAAQIVTGIGFIGGGAVLRHGGNIRGLTTAASLWMMASIGMLAGMGNYLLSLIATLATFFVLFTFGRIERSYFAKHLKKYDQLKLIISVKNEALIEVQDWLDKRYATEITELKCTTSTEQNTSRLTYTINVHSPKFDIHGLSRKINAINGVKSTDIRFYHEEEK
jgi:putative Mg2+ transporter-C (MgtC) family protein